MKKFLVVGVFSIALLVTLTYAGAYLLPWHTRQWGQIELAPSRQITVSGTAKQMQRNQIASFDAGVSAVNDQKDVAVKQVNEAITKIIESVKATGIPAEDIQTQNMSIYQGEETFYEGGVPKQRLGQWRVNNNIQIKVRDMAKIGEFADLLTKSGATNVYGPNFSVDDIAELENGLLKDALADARQKAEAMAVASGAKLRSILTVVEGGSSLVNPLPMMSGMAMGGGGGTALEVGGQQVSKSVTVTFSLQ
jgi:uncharacterized protein YggE